MNRRGFIQFLGAFAAGAAIPGLAHEKIARVYHWWAKGKPVAVYRVAKPLAAGMWTFVASATTKGEYMGVTFMGVKAEGGETLFEVLCPDGTEYTRFTLCKGINLRSGEEGCEMFYESQQEVTVA